MNYTEQYSEFTDVERVRTKVRLALTGPTNSGKTYTALLIAFGITKDWKKIAFVDSERGRGRFYANRTDLPYPTGSFKYVAIEPPYTTLKYIDLIKKAEALVGPDGVIIVDSFSHPWSYSGGVLDQKEEIAKQKGQTSYTAWNESGKIQNNLVDTALSVNCHIIVTMRSKMDYVLEKNAEGKSVPRKVGLAPIQRDDTEYEFDITLMLDNDHTATIIKDTTFLGDKGKTIDALTPLFGEQLISWLNEGTDPAIFEEQLRISLCEEVKNQAKASTNKLTFFKTKYPETPSAKLTKIQAKELLNIFKELN